MADLKYLVGVYARDMGNINTRIEREPNSLKNPKRTSQLKFLKDRLSKAEEAQRVGQVEISTNAERDKALGRGKFAPKEKSSSFALQ